VRVVTTDLERSVPGVDGPRWLYRGVNLSFAASSVTAVIGPNGAGKSTLLRDLAGVRALAGGEVVLDGRALADYSPIERARRIAYLPQRTSLEHDMPVREIVSLGRAPYVGRFAAPSDRDREIVGRALSQVGLDPLADRPVHSLSGGEFRRVMLARMLATEAQVLVLDEPIAALDIGHALAFLGLCRRLARDGATVIVAIHELDLARRYADESVLLTGDPRGVVHVGSAREVIVPALLEPVFEVAVTERAGHLHFSSLRSADAREGRREI
jgi:iron complex transport system ATP-binding protein